jgi:DNA-binding NarL/FixJ family response regulator
MQLRVGAMTYKVLIVDDSKLARMAVMKALSALQPDWTRVEASNADEALELVRSQAVDLALLDFNMPGRDGLSLAEELRAMRPLMPIAIISANYQTEIVNRTQEIGAAFLSKPLTTEAMHGFLETARASLGKSPA